MTEKNKDKLNPRQDPPDMPGDIPPGVASICNKCGQIHDKIEDGGG